MNGKKARAIRKAVQANNEVDLKKPDLRVSKEKKKIIYETNIVDGLPKTEAKTIVMQSIVNVSKTKYKQFKKVFNTLPSELRNMFNV